MHIAFNMNELCQVSIFSFTFEFQYSILRSFKYIIFFFFKFYSHNCYFNITIQTIQIHIAATNYMPMFYLFFGIEKKRVLLENIIFPFLLSTFRSLAWPFILCVYMFVITRQTCVRNYKTGSSYTFRIHLYVYIQIRCCTNMIF